ARSALFSLCMIFAAQAKLTPIFFAVLLITVCPRPQWGWFAATLAGFAAVFSLNEWLQPGLFRNFWAVSALLDERGLDCPSVLALIRDVFDQVLSPSFTNASRLDELLFLVAVAVVSVISGYVLVRYRSSVPVVDERLLICFSCFVF